ncbi:MAG: ABC transporter ATP-binding protein/permease [Lachnospiraceae bacterium]|nr:ABC transporter ATP-binding protein/permease [Lachnospiraceae bacterium]
MKHLLKFLKPYIKESILGPLFKLTEATFELFVPLVVAGIISNGIEKGNNPYIIKMGGLMVLLAVIGLTCAVTAQYFAAKAATGFAASLREAIFENIQSRSYTELEEYGTGTLITRITSDVNQLQTGVNLFLRLFLRSPFIVFGAVVMAFTVNVKAALIFVICVPILFVVVFFVLIKSIPLYKKVQNSLDAVTIRTRENLTGIRVIRAFNCNDEETTAFNEKIDSLKSIQLFAGRVTAIMNPATFLIVNVATLAVLYVGANEVNTEIINRGELIALLNYMAQILVELIKLANLIITMTKSLACADRISDMLNDGENRVKTVGTDKENNPFEKIDTIEFKNVGFTYPKAKKESLKNISFSAKKGEIIGIIGGTGSGKTTLVNLICGYYSNSEGKININGINMKEYAEANCFEKTDEKEGSEKIKPFDSVFTSLLRDKTGIVPQTAVLFSGSVEENLKWGKKDATEEEMKTALRRAQAYDFIFNDKDGLNTSVSEGGKNFSGGQRQRLSIARAFVKEPELLILDDSTSALDYVTEREVRKGIRELASDSVCFIVSQRAAGIMDADRILVLDDGELAGCAGHDELLRTCTVYREIYKSQFPEEELPKMEELA